MELEVFLLVMLMLGENWQMLLSVIDYIKRK